MPGRSCAYSSQFTMMKRTREPTIAAIKIPNDRSSTLSRFKPLRSAARAASDMATRNPAATRMP